VYLSFSVLFLFLFVLLYVDSLLGGDWTVTIARQWPAKNNRGMVFSIRSMPKCFKQDNWSSELVVGQLPASKNVTMEAEDTVEIHHQATTGEDIVD
jgi:hypothetical protein